MINRSYYALAIAFAAIVVLGGGFTTLSAADGFLEFGHEVTGKTYAPGDKVGIIAATPNGKWEMRVLDATGAAVCVTWDDVLPVTTCRYGIQWDGVKPRGAVTFTLPTDTGATGVQTWSSTLTDAAAGELKATTTFQIQGSGTTATTTSSATETTPGTTTSPDNAPEPTDVSAGIGRAFTITDAVILFSSIGIGAIVWSQTRANPIVKTILVGGGLLGVAVWVFGIGGFS